MADVLTCDNLQAALVKLHVPPRYPSYRAQREVSPQDKKVASAWFNSLTEAELTDPETELPTERLYEEATKALKRDLTPADIYAIKRAARQVVQTFINKAIVNCAGKQASPEPEPPKPAPATKQEKKKGALTSKKTEETTYQPWKPKGKTQPPTKKETPIPEGVLSES